MGTFPERWAARRVQSKGGSPLGLCEVVRGGGSSCSMPTDPTATHRADRGWSEVWKRRPLRARRGVMWGTGVRQGRAQGRRLVRRSRSVKHDTSQGWEWVKTSCLTRFTTRSLPPSAFVVLACKPLTGKPKGITLFSWLTSFESPARFVSRFDKHTVITGWFV
jgi:hypothetical protein